MKPYYILIVASVVTLALIHSILNIMNILPINPLTKHYIQFANLGNLGIFSQKWPLFAPDPPTSTWRLEYRCMTNKGGWTYWEDPSVPLLEAHYKYRFSHHHYTMRVFRGAMRDLHNARQEIAKDLKCQKDDQKCLNQLRKKIRELSSFKFTNRLVYRLCDERLEAVTLVHFRSKTIKVGKFSERNHAVFNHRQMDYQHYPMEDILLTKKYFETMHSKDSDESTKAHGGQKG